MLDKRATESVLNCLNTLTLLHVDLVVLLLDLQLRFNVEYQSDQIPSSKLVGIYHDMLIQSVENK